MPVQHKLRATMTTETPRITRVTTGNGDTGQTRLATNIKVSKTDPLVRALGSADELNSAIGVLRCYVQAPVLDDMLAQQQQLLFDIGAVLAMGGDYATDKIVDGLVTVTANSEELNQQLPPLTEFVIPGGNLASAYSHMCRTICRRAESDLWLAVESWEKSLDAENTARIREAGACLNRLSDFFFVLARTLIQGLAEPQWRGPSNGPPSPGKVP